jgi:hypothetical protein
MCKNCVKIVEFVKKACGVFYTKLWVILNKKNIVGKVTTFFTLLPTNFLQLFSTHKPLLVCGFSPLSTVSITTIKYIIRKDTK